VLAGGVVLVERVALAELAVLAKLAARAEPARAVVMGQVETVAWESEPVSEFVPEHSK